MRGINRTLVNPPVSSRDAFAEIDARNADKAAYVEGEDIEAQEQAALEVDCDRREEIQRERRASGSTPC